MKLLIHDLSEDNAKALRIDGAFIIAANEKAAHCMGCFGCWLRTPSRCVLKDRLQKTGGLFGEADEITVVSQNCYGGYSYAVKKVIDRSIAMSRPFFTYRGGKIHHILRYKNRPKLKVYLYGDMTEFEKEIAQELVTANGINMGATDSELITVNSYTQVLEVLL